MKIQSVKITLFVFVMAMLQIQIIAQAPLKHEKKTYRSPEGKLYVQKELPIYLRIATSPAENAPTYLLKSEVTSKYSNPMYLDAEGYNTFRAPSCVDTVTLKTVLPEQDIVFEVYADSHSPLTNAKFANAKTKLHKGKNYTRGSAEIVMEASDALSGVSAIYYSVDSVDFKEYAGQLLLEKEKEYNLQYYAVDNVGNAEKVKSFIVVVDKSTPKTKLSLSGSVKDNVLAANVKILLNAEDNGIGLSKIMYKIDEGPEHIFLKSIDAARIEQGEHKLTFWSVDQVENKEEDQVFDFYVDKTPPAIVQEIIGKSFVANGREFSSGRSQLKITTFDNKSGVKEVFYSINNGEYKLYEKPIYLANSQGNLAIKSYAVDFVGNRSVYDESESGKSSYSYVDLTGPSLNGSFDGPLFVYNDTVFVNNQTKIKLKADDAESGLNRIEYSVNQGDIAVYDKPVIIETEGFVNLKYIGYDNVDNTNNNNMVFFVDKTGPEVFYRFSSPVKNISKSEEQTVELYPNHVVLFVSATDLFTGFSKMTYSINGSVEKAFSGIISDFPASEKNTIVIKAYDKLGNVTQKDVVFGIDKSINKNIASK